jgi:hypothetical protein
VPKKTIVPSRGRRPAATGTRPPAAARIQAPAAALLDLQQAAGNQALGSLLGAPRLRPGTGEPGEAAPAPAGFAAQLSALRGGGVPLSPSLRSFFEPRFGHDFGAVRLHTGAAAERSASAAAARAFTFGNDVVFGRGEFAPGTPAGRRLLAHELTHVVQQTPLVARRQPLVQRAPDEAQVDAPAASTAESSPGSADGAAGAAVAAPGEGAAPASAAPQTAAPEGGGQESAPAPSGPDAAPANTTQGEPAATASPEAAGTAAAPPEGAGPETAAQAPVVEDDAAEVGEGQMKKSAFLVELRGAVCAAVEAALAGSSQQGQGCSTVELWLAPYQDQSAAEISRDLARFSSGARRPATAAQHIAAIARRARAGVAEWLRTGEVTGVPAGLAPPAAVAAAAGPPAAGTATGPPAAGAATGPPAAAAATGPPAGPRLKARPGGPRPGPSPAAIQGELGAGRPLEGSLRARMESAFGLSFAHVRVHHDARSAALADRMNARAFALGTHVAFGPRDYRPGTLHGDALIAHELAHVVQQGGEGDALAPLAIGGGSSPLERDADAAAAGAVMSLWGALGALRGAARQAMPLLRSGLRLQRCIPGCQDCGTRDAGPAPDAGPDAGPAPVQIDAVQICANSVTTTLSPATATGRFSLRLTGGGNPFNLLQAERSGGNFNDRIPFDTVPVNQEFTTMEAVWSLPAGDQKASTAAHFKSMGQIRHTQYNCPNQTDASCAGGVTPTCFSDAQCHYSAPEDLPATFVNQVLNPRFGTGCGLTAAHGNVQQEAFCVRQKSHPVPANCQGHVLRQNVPAIAGSCGGAALTDASVAVNDQMGLPCGTSICIMLPAGGRAKTVADRCPACGTTRIDNFSTSGACGIADLATAATTLRLF